MLGRPQDKLLTAEQYAAAYNAEYDFEAHLVRARQNSCLRFLSAKQPLSVLEVGCGASLLADRLDEISHPIGTWQIVEPAAAFALPARERLAAMPGFGVTVGYLEDCESELRARAPTGYDAVLLSSVMHETSEPLRLLRSAAALLAPHGWLLVNVPNALSMHRLLAVHMGLIDRPDAVTERNSKLGQGIVHTVDSVRTLLAAAGFAPPEFEGYMMKFLTHVQMQNLVDSIGPAIVTGLEQLGRQFPDNAAEIAFFARKA